MFFSVELKANYPQNLSMQEIHNPSRRNFLRYAAGLGLVAMLPTTVLGNDFWSMPRELWLERAETGESIRAQYFANGQILTPGYVATCQLLRDVKARTAVQMSPVLLDILCGMQGWLRAYGVEKPIIVNSGYRTILTNSKIEGAARASMHLWGKAADVRIDGIPTRYLAELGLYLRGGGVGFYPGKGMVHVDDGRLRVWRG